jgi:F1F0 ATPase subunit 2
MTVIDIANNALMEGFLSFLAGGSLGALFFIGLWWTVRNIGSSQYVALLFLGSMLLRTGMVIVGFYYVLGDSWQQLLLGLLGFVVVRTVASRFMRLAEQSGSIQKKSDYAP